MKTIKKAPFERNSACIALILLSFFFLNGCSEDEKPEPESPKELPAVATLSISEITKSSAKTGGNVTSDGGAAVTARGVVWSISPNPTLADSKTTNGNSTGEFVAELTGLEAGTTYNVRAYATNSEGTAYGDERTFTTTALPAEPKAYVAVQLQGAKNRALCWKDTDIINLSDGGRHAFAKSVFVTETDLYVAGEEHSASSVYVAKYWKNGEAIYLSDGVKHAFATGIVVSDNIVYVSGSQETSGQRQAKYWVNGTEHNLTDGSKYTVATSIAVSGSDVYVAGYMNEPMEVARYWKNGGEVILPMTNNTVRSAANSIFVSGTDVYVAGYQRFDVANGNKNIATLWKNGNIILLGSLANHGYATAVSVKNGNVYVAGYENENGINVAKYWKNQTAVPLSNGSIDEHTSSIFISDQEDVYVAGYSGNINSGIKAKYWKNGQSHSNASGTYAWGIFVY